MNCKSILLVEDDPEIRIPLTKLLISEGYEVTAAINGQDGIDLLPQMPKPCLILLDLMMPIMDGWEFLKIKEHDVSIAPIPVVVVTALEDDEIKSVEPPAKRVIRKPINIDVLISTVREYCGMSVGAQGSHA